MKYLSLSLAASSLLLTIQINGWSQAKTSTPLHQIGVHQSSVESKVKTVLLQPKPSLRVGEVLPGGELPLLDGRVWKANDNLSKRSTLLLYVSPEVEQQQKMFIPMIAFVLAAHQERLKAEGIDPVLVVPANFVLPPAIPEAPPEILASVRKVKIARIIPSELGDALSGAQLKILVTDRAGFLREVTPLPLYSATRERLLDILQNLHGQQLTPQPGQLAPDFSVPTTSWAQPKGQSLRLSDFRGRKNVLLTFFPRCFTGSCTFQLSSLRDQASAFAANDIQVIAVSVDPADGEKGQTSFARKNEFTFPFVPDVNRNLCLLYGAAQSPQQMALRMSVFIDKSGIIRWIDKQIEPRTHGADVLERWKKENVAETTVVAPTLPMPTAP